MKYVIHLFDAKKQPLNNERIEVNNSKIEICNNEFVFKHLHYVKVQAKWMEWHGPMDEFKPVQSKSTMDAYNLLNSEKTLQHFMSKCCII